MQKAVVFLLFLVSYLTGRSQGHGDSILDVQHGSIQLGSQGFPEQILMYIPDGPPVGPAYGGQKRPIRADSLLAENIHFHFTRASDGKDIRLKSGGWQFTKRSSRASQWKAVISSEELRVEVNGSSVFAGGMLSYAVKVTALSDMDLKDIVMHIPFRKEMAAYMKGLDLSYGVRPDSMYAWKWVSGRKDQPVVWIGTPEAGLQYSLTGPGGWANEGNGGINIGIKGKSMLANNYSGPRHLQKDETIQYDFSLRLTPPEK